MTSRLRHGFNPVAEAAPRAPQTLQQTAHRSPMCAVVIGTKAGREDAGNRLGSLPQAMRPLPSGGGFSLSVWRRTHPQIPGPGLFHPIRFIRRFTG